MPPGVALAAAELLDWLWLVPPQPARAAASRAASVTASVTAQRVVLVMGLPLVG